MNLEKLYSMRVVDAWEEFRRTDGSQRARFNKVVTRLVNNVAYDVAVIHRRRNERVTAALIVSSAVFGFIVGYAL